MCITNQLNPTLSRFTIVINERFKQNFYYFKLQKYKIEQDNLPAKHYMIMIEGKSSVTKCHSPHYVDHPTAKNRKMKR